MRERKAFLCGIDEAGRGCLAGPVCAAAVILPEDFNFSLLDDSKKLSPKKRFAAAQVIYSDALAWGVGWASNVEIDSVNIHNATLLAMSRAYKDAATMLSQRIGIPLAQVLPLLEVVVDGLYTPSLECALCRAVVKADASIREVMAASILAKTERDTSMCHYAELYPGYSYEKHKGYGTREHVAAIAELGPSPIQRSSFKVKKDQAPKS